MRIQFFPSLLISIFLMLSLPAIAHPLKNSGNTMGGSGDGGWIGMGGELFKDARNPWFVKNTQQVFYCIQLEKKDMSIDETAANAAFNDALNFWKEEFFRAMHSTDGSFALATQDFKKVSCEDPQVQLRILFGAGLLNDKEREFLKDPEHYVGVTVRQEYDRKNLQAKGFMFFSNDLNRRNFVPAAWSRPKILRYALMHELGHVFGLPHIGTGLMSEVFLDQLIKVEYIDQYERLPVESVVSPNLELTNCEIVTPATRNFFSIPADYSCIILKNFGPFALKVFSQKSSSEVLNELGTIKMDTPSPNDFSGKPISFLQLPDEQTVFTAKEAGFRSFMIGPIGMEFGASGKFIPKIPGPAKALYAKINANSFSFIGTQPNGNLGPVLQYSSPIGFIYILPARP
ncbi:MAG: hypothetical protein ACXVB1_13565 [Pseudobdellovibrionaceae bacterium]